MAGWIVTILACIAPGWGVIGKEVAGKIGIVEVNMNGTACKVPFAKDYIQKVVDKQRIGKKRKTARC